LIKSGILFPAVLIGAGFFWVGIVVIWLIVGPWGRFLDGIAPDELLICLDGSLRAVPLACAVCAAYDAGAGAGAVVTAVVFVVAPEARWTIGNDSHKGSVPLRRGPDDSKWQELMDSVMVVLSCCSA
jgi:hypothetical protein